MAGKCAKFSLKISAFVATNAWQSCRRAVTPSPPPPDEEQHHSDAYWDMILMKHTNLKYPWFQSRFLLTKDAQLIESARPWKAYNPQIKRQQSRSLTWDLKVASLKPDRSHSTQRPNVPASLLTIEPGKYHVEVSSVTSTYIVAAHPPNAAARSRAVAVTPIAASRDEVLAWAGLCYNTAVSKGFSHCWHSLSGAKTCGGKKEGKYSPGH